MTDGGGAGPGLATPAGAEGIAWPPICVGPPAQALTALIEQFEKTQWLAPADLAGHQRRQLAALARHAAKQSTHFRRRLARARLRPKELEGAGALGRLGVLGRRDIQGAGAALFCKKLPRGHGPLMTTQTSGSTGEPVVVRRTGVSRMIWMATTMRDHIWHRRDLSKRLSAVRANIPNYVQGRDWGLPVNLLGPSGRAQGIPINAPAARQAAWLRQFKPGYLLIYPNALDALNQYCDAHGVTLEGLEQIRSIGETLTPRVRDHAARVFKVPVLDTYSSQEVGTIALQCPDSGLYHVMAESLIVEVLDRDDRPCAVGQPGRIVVTDLHNYATPLIRYDIGDYGELADPCPCGRGLPALRRILGRERNLVLMPDGTRRYPLVGFARFRDVAPVVQYQLVQHDAESIEVRLVTEGAMTPDQEAALAAVIRDALGHAFAFRFTYFQDRIPPGPGGKFEEFVCRVP